MGIFELSKHPVLTHVKLFKSIELKSGNMTGHKISNGFDDHIK